MKSLLKFVSLLIFLALTFNVNAQIYLGPKVGINFATFGGDDVNSDSDNLRSLVCSQFGIATQIRLNESFTIQPEFLYYQKGIRSKFDLFGEDYTIKQRLNYFEIPVLAKFMFFAQEAGQIYAAAGPSFGFGLNGKIKSDDIDEDFNFDDNNLTRLDISLTVGAGIQVPVGPGKVFLDVRYLLGLNSIDGSNSDIKNRGIAIGLGYLLSIGG